ncbi:MAG: DNA repair protein RecN [Flavobacteriales bacterium]|nr:DNA repair protein RecN [Flavobacteriales bacterium]
MITQLLIRNYAIIDNLEIDFAGGFTTITGETGAGKSIILGALNLLLGHRFESINFKDKTKKSIIEGVFNISNLHLKDLFLSHELEYDKTLIIRREFSFSGLSRAFINDTPVKLDLLKNLGFFLVDIHSQHENLLLRDDTFQLQVIDAFSKNKFPEFENIYSEYRDVFNELHTLEITLESKKRLLSRTDLDITHKEALIVEIENLNLQIGEKDEIELEYKKMNNLNEIKGAISDVTSIFEDIDNSIMSNLHIVISKLESIQQYDSVISDLLKRVKVNSIDMNDIMMEFHSINQSLNLDPNRLILIQDRFDAINRLEKKLNLFGINEILNKLSEMKEELKLFNSISKEINKIEIQIQSLEKKLFHIAHKLTVFRKKSAIELTNVIIVDLADLGIKNANIKFNFLNQSQLSPYGLDKVNLLFSSNQGYELKPIGDVASGGEISRLMLCLKKNLFNISQFSTIIFDEIDSGVSGEIGRKIGRVLKKMSKKGQVLCITHLPQIASLGDSHYRVLKYNNNNITTTKISKLSSEGQVQEIARMLSGDELNDEAIANAKKC